MPDDVEGNETREAAEEPMIRRTFESELSPSGDGRTLDVRIVPYNVVARVSDGGPSYDEVWLPGAFDKQLNAPNRVLANFEHQPGIGGVVARGTQLRDTDSGLEGTFRMLDGPNADTALELVNEEVLTGVSLEAVPLRSVVENGLVKRVKARLVNIALCRSPAYAGAQVLAVREAPQYVVNFTGTSANSNPVPIATWALAEREEPEPEPEEPTPEPPEPEVRHEVEEALQRAGYEALVVRAVVRKPWDGSASRFEDDEYSRSCLVCREGDDPPKSRCSLPVLEPNGDLNVNGMHAAASRLSQTSLSPELKSKAARKLVRYYRQAGEEPPPNVVSAASR